MSAAVAVLATGVAVSAAVLVLRPPRPRLSGRVRPYAAAALSALGHPVAELPVAGRTPRRSPRGRLVALLRGGADDPVARLRLRQSGRYDAPEELLLAEHRVRVLLGGVAGAALGLATAAAGGAATPAALAVGVLGAVAGAARPRAAVDRAVAQRRARVRAEVPALCHLLALRLRARGSAVGAVADTIARSRGLLVDELAEALAQHRAGRPLDEALDAAALVTPSPDAARVHRLIAGTVRHGVDAVPELLRLSREVRQAHLLQLRREATGRRAAVLVPIVGLLAPLILLFLAAPIPGLLAGG